jgi:hypothetical protein
MGCFSSRTIDQGIVKAQAEVKEEQKIPPGRVQVEPVKIGKSNEKHSELSKTEKKEDKDLVTQNNSTLNDQSKREDKTKQNSDAEVKTYVKKGTDETVAEWLQDIYKKTLITITAKV